MQVLVCARNELVSLLYARIEGDQLIPGTDENLHGDGMPTTMVSHQALQYEGLYKGAMFSTMASHQVLHHEDPIQGETFSTMVSHQVLHHEDPYNDEEAATNTCVT